MRSATQILKIRRFISPLDRGDQSEYICCLGLRCGSNGSLGGIINIVDSTFNISIEGHKYCFFSINSFILLVISAFYLAHHKYAPHEGYTIVHR